MKKIFLLSIFFGSITTADAQFWKKNKDEAAPDSSGTKKEEKKSGGGGLFQKVVGKLAKGAAKLGGTMTGATKSTADLDAVAPYVFFSGNLLSKDIGTMEMDFINGWKDGGDLVGVMFMPTNRAFFYKIDGSVKIDGKDADYQSTGVYTKVFDGANASRTMEVETSSGQKAKFTLIPPKNKVKLVSINNKKENCEIDMNKDFSIQVENFSTQPGSLLKLRIVMQTIGIRSTYEVGNFKPAASITIPGYILKHINSGNKGMNFKNSYLIVDDAQMQEAKDEGGKYSTPLRYYTGTSAALPVKVVNESPILSGLTAAGEEKLALGKMKYEFTKPNAYSSKPFEQVKNVAVTSFAISGTTYYYDHSENKFLNTETTKSIDFPQIPDEKLDAILAGLYQQITTVLQEQFGATILAPEKVTSTKEYKALDRFSYDNSNTSEHFTRSYKGLQPLATIIPLATAMSGESALFAATGANALLKVKLDLQISFDNKPILKPIMTVELAGDKNGGEFGLMLTKFFTAKIEGEGYRIKSGVQVTDAVLNEIVRQDDLVAQFKKGLQEIIAKEKQNGEYVPIWNLQK
ncbi:MAG: hypothetical protein QM791_03130 [Ferruginibacter sp.]